MQVTNCLGQVPNGVYGDIHTKVRRMVANWDQQDHFSTAVELAEELFSLQQPRVRQLFWSAHKGVVCIGDAFSCQGADGIIGFP